jgi:flagellar basal-body rod protein FlgB
MNLADIPLFAMLKGRLSHQAERQRVIAGNVANSDTPGFKPYEIKPYSFDAHMKGVVPTPVQAVTQAGHIATGGGARKPAYKTHKTADSETTLNGNAVVLEDEMIKLTEARMNYDAAITFYQKSLGLIRLASRAPGRG